MGLEVATIAAISLGVTAVGTVLSYTQQQKAEKQQKKQWEESNRLAQAGQAKEQERADLQTMRAKRAAAREAQQRRADVTAAATQRNVGTSTPVQGAQSSFGTQLGGQLSFLDTSTKLSSQAASLFGQSRAIGTQPIRMSSVGSVISSLGGTVFNAAVSMPDIFSASPATATGYTGPIYSGNTTGLWP